MKKLKSMFVLCLAFVMVMSLSTNALAAKVVNETNHDFAAYQIFSGTQAEGDASLGNVDWGSGIDPVGLVTELKAKNPTLYNASVPALTASSTAAEKKAAAAAVVAALLRDGGGADYHADADQFANIAVNHVVGSGTEIAKDATSASLAAGYYLIVDKTANLDKGDAKNPALLQVTNKSNIQIAKKYNVPTVDKYIVHGTQTKDVDSHAIGDTVYFRLDGTVANNLEDYEVYRLVFHDAMSEGLTFDPTSVKVYSDGTEITTGYTLVTSGMTCSHGKDCTFEVVFADVLQVPAIQNNSNVYVEYSATVNEKAVVNGPNPNSVLLEFSNDPDWEVPPPGGTTLVPPTGVTPWHDVVVYTTEVSLSKIDNHENPLVGAEFTLSGEKTNVVKITADRFVEDAAGTYWELTDGTYTTTDPATPGIDTATYKDVTKTYKLTTVQEFKYTKSSEVAKAFVGYDGKLKFTGLGPGVYTVTESVVPSGYNPIEAMTLTVTFDEDTEQFSYDWAWPGGHSFSSSAQIQVINQKGSVLPETGGAGTTMIYVSGTVLVAAAAALLVLKKRKAEEN